MERRPHFGRIPDEELCPVEQGLGINHILHEKVDEFEKLVVDDLVVNEFLDLVKECDFVGGSERLLLGRKGRQSRLDVFQQGTLPPLARTGPAFAALSRLGSSTRLDAGTRSRPPFLLTAHLLTLLARTSLLTCDFFGGGGGGGSSGSGRCGAGSLHE